MADSENIPQDADVVQPEDEGFVSHYIDNSMEVVAKPVNKMK
jgi:hypothetical protein